jgi:DNA-binding transcriptional MerR regulator/Lon protease-like protein
MAKTVDKQWLTAAECAARTGLTVRALRVYEREGLVSPARSEKGWRRYGPAEVARLNTVTTLKALGLTLEQIRQVMTSTPPPLAQILHIQTESWRAKRAAAERALRLLEVARGRAASRALSLDELCELVKGLELSRSTEMQSATFRKLLSESLSAEEERALNAWWADHPADLAAARDSRESLGAIYTDIEQLAQERADSPAVQALVRRFQSTLTRSGSRERAVRLMQWNPWIGARFYGLGSKVAAHRRGLSEHPEQGTLSRQGVALLTAALQASPVAQASRELILEVRKLLSNAASAESPVADTVAQRMREICEIHDLGEPLVYVQWLRLMAHVNPTVSHNIEVDDVAWAFLARAIAHRDHCSESDMRELDNWLGSAPASSPAGRAIERVPVIPLRDVVVYPGMVMPLFAGRPRTIGAAEAALRGDKRVVLLTQRQPGVNDPAAEDLYLIGTNATVLDVSKIENGTLKIMVKGLTRARVDRVHVEDPLSADITLLAETSVQDGAEVETLRNDVLARFEQYAQVSGWPPRDARVRPEPPPLASLVEHFGRLESGRLADTIAAHTPLQLAQKQEVLEMLDVRQRLEYVDAATRNLQTVTS